MPKTPTKPPTTIPIDGRQKPATAMATKKQTTAVSKSIMAGLRGLQGGRRVDAMIWAIQTAAVMIPSTNTPKLPKTLKTPATTSTARTKMAQSGTMSRCLMAISLWAVQAQLLARVPATSRLTSA